MPYYFWEGVTIEGEPKQGAFESKEPADAINDLGSSGIFNVNLIHVPPEWLERPIREKHLLELLSHLKKLLDSGLEFTQALAFSIQQQPHPYLKYVISSIRQSLEKGEPLSVAFKSFPECFPDYLKQLLQVGEASDQLPEVLNKTLSFLNTKYELSVERSKLLLYPSMVACLSTFILLGILIWVVPMFRETLLNMGGKLPLLTEVLFQLSVSLRAHPYLWSLCGVTFLGGVIYTHRRGWWEIALRQLPYISTIHRHFAISFYARVLSIMLRMGLDTRDCLDTALCFFEEPLRSRVQQSHQLIQAGGRFSLSYESAHVFPTLFLNIIAIGESSEDLANSYAHASEIYLETSTRSIKRLNSLVEPLSMLSIAIVILIVLISIYLPMFQMAGQL